MSDLVDRWMDIVSSGETPARDQEQQAESGGLNLWLEIMDSIPEEEEEQPDYSEIIRDPVFKSMISSQANAQRAQVDPRYGDYNSWMNEVDDNMANLVRRYGFTEQQIATLAREHFVEDMTGSPNIFGPMDQLGRDLLGAAEGVFETIQAGPDFTLTFATQLANVQQQARGGDGTGNPAPNPVAAAGELTQAFGRTIDQLGWNEWPFRQTEDAEGGVASTGWEWNPESAWVFYAPDIYWNRFDFRLGYSVWDNSEAVRGYEFNERFRIAERLGVESEEGKQFLGVATEFMADPLLWADWMFASAKGLQLAGGLAGSRALTDAGRQLDDLAGGFYRAVTPAGVAREAHALATLVDPIGIVPMTDQIVNSAINRALDVRVPWPHMTQERRVARDVQGWGNQAPNPRVRDILFQGGQVENLENASPLAILAGGEESGPAAYQLAKSRSTQIQAISARAATDIHEALSDGLTRPVHLRAPGARVDIPGARVVAEEHQGYYRALQEIVSDYVGNYGGETPFTVTPAGSLAEPGKIPADIMERLEAAARVAGQPVEDALQRFRGAERAARAATVTAGYWVLDYPGYWDAMEYAAREMGLNPAEARRAYEWYVGSADVQAAELGGQIPMMPATRAESAGWTPTPAQGTPEWQRTADIEADFIVDEAFRDQYEGLIAQRLTDQGKAELAAISPSEYFGGLVDGYLTRTFGAFENPQNLIAAVDGHNLVVMRDLSPETLTTDLATHLPGDFDERQVGAIQSVVDDFLTSRTAPTPRNVPAGSDLANQSAVIFNIDDLTVGLERALGRSVDPSTVSRAIYANDANAQYLDTTLALLRSSAKRRATASGVQGSPYALRPIEFQEREVMGLEDLVARAVIRDPAAQVAEMGLRASHQVGASDYLKALHQVLDESGSIRDPNSFPRNTGVQDWNQESVFAGLVAEDGTRYVAVPNNREVWGPLAGQAIPEEAGELFLRTMEYGGGDPHVYQRLLTMWRRGLISPLPTAMRNILGNYVIISRAGGDLGGVLGQTTRAHELRDTFMRTGAVPEEFQGYEHIFNLFLTQSAPSTLTGDATNGLQQALTAISRGEMTPQGALEWLETMNRRVTETAPFGFLPLFQYGEELSRTSAFLWTYETLMTRGVPKDEAINRAAHFAMNSAYNYGATPLLPETLKRTGLSAFPQFAYFTAGRTPRALLENPRSYAYGEHVRQGINVALEPDEQERITLSETLRGSWRAGTNPLLVPIRSGDDGEIRYMLDLSYTYPESTNVLDIFTDPLVANALTPAIDRAWAIVNRTGVGPAGEQWGAQYWDPADPTWRQVVSGATGLAADYMIPGVQRMGRIFGEGLEYQRHREFYDEWSVQTGRFYNREPWQTVGRSVGLNTYAFSTDPQQPSYQDRIMNIRYQYLPQIESLESQIEEAAGRADFTQDPDALARLERLEADLAAVEERMNSEIDRVNEIFSRPDTVPWDEALP